MSRLQGKKAILTASGQGIGRAVAEAFLREGASVVATDVDVAKLADLDGAEAMALDARNTEQVNRLADTVGAVDILFNCAGFVHHGTVLDCDEDAWDLSFDLNVKSMHRMIRAFLPAMLENGGGSIINMSSGASSLKGAPNRYAYGATKAAVIGLTKSVAQDFIRDGIRSNAICPGTIDSPSLRDRIAALGESLGGGYAEAERLFIARQPMGRIGTADEVAALAVYLASDESRFTTGTTHVIDGGWTL